MDINGVIDRARAGLGNPLEDRIAQLAQAQKDIAYSIALIQKSTAMTQADKDKAIAALRVQLDAIVTEYNGDIATYNASQGGTDPNKQPQSAVQQFLNSLASTGKTVAWLAGGLLAAVVLVPLLRKK